MSKTFAVFVVLLDCSIALGNIGGFRQDAAHTIRLVPTAEIQLQSEEVVACASYSTATSSDCNWISAVGTSRMV